ncbi:MAG: hypothetical protein AB7U75_14570 [Hyphomicrobiaceae bacterium]
MDSTRKRLTPGFYWAYVQRKYYGEDKTPTLIQVIERDDGTFHARDFKFDIDPSFRALYWFRILGKAECPYTTGAGKELSHP